MRKNKITICSEISKSIYSIQIYIFYADSVFLPKFSIWCSDHLIFYEFTENQQKPQTFFGLKCVLTIKSQPKYVVFLPTILNWTALYRLKGNLNWFSVII